MRAREKGVGIVFVAVVLVLVAAAALGFLALTRTSVGTDRSLDTQASLARVANALEQFASTAERLPCPANPAVDAGDAVPNVATDVCSFPNGSVPWRTLGLRREDALDAWGWKISYRVYGGATGLTQAKGASMVDCDTNEPAPAGTEANGTCKATRDTTEAQFLYGKGLAVSDFGAAVTDVAYVLISHGPSGTGAYTSAGVQRTPLPTNVDETANLGITGPFVAKAAVATVLAEDATHFDDVLAYRRLAEFVKRANLSARDWPDSSTTQVTLNSPTVSAAIGHAASYGDLGQATLTVQNATVTGLNSGGARNISFDTVNGTEGIGIVGGSAGTMNALSSDAGEGLRIAFTSRSRLLAVTLSDFGRLTGVGNAAEQVTFAFFDGATALPAITKAGCRPDGGLATFVIDAGADFDTVEIRAVSSTGGGVSQFFLAQFKACAAGAACGTSLSNAANLCA